MEEGGRGIMPTVVNEEELTGVTDGVVEEDDNEMAMAREVEREGWRWTMGTVMARCRVSSRMGRGLWTTVCSERS